MSASDWIALGALIVAALSCRHIVRKSRENADAVRKAQETADRANKLAEDAVSVNKERLHAEVLPALGFEQGEHHGAPTLWFQNRGCGPAHSIQIDAVVADDCPPDRHREHAEGVLREWKKLCDGITLNPEDRKPIASSEAMLPYIEVRSLTFEDQYRKRFTLHGASQCHEAHRRPHPINLYR